HPLMHTLTYPLTHSTHSLAHSTHPLTHHTPALHALCVSALLTRRNKLEDCKMRTRASAARGARAREFATEIELAVLSCSSWLRWASGADVWWTRLSQAAAAGGGRRGAEAAEQGAQRAAGDAGEVAAQRG